MNNLDWFVGPKPTHPAGDLEHGLLSAQILLSVVSVASCSKRIAVFRFIGYARTDSLIRLVQASEEERA
jgi:hypothetical protein